MKRITCLYFFLSVSASAQGDVEFELGRVSKEVVELERLVVKGVHEAEYKLAEMLTWGVGVRGNFNRALELFGRACQGGYWRGCSMHARDLMQKKKYNEAESILLKTFREQQDWVYASQLARLYMQKNWTGYSQWKSIQYKALSVSLRDESNEE